MCHTHVCACVCVCVFRSENSIYGMAELEHIWRSIAYSLFLCLHIYTVETVAWGKLMGMACMHNHQFLIQYICMPCNANLYFHGYAQHLTLSRLIYNPKFPIPSACKIYIHIYLVYIFLDMWYTWTRYQVLTLHLHVHI